MTPNYVRLSLLHRAALEAVGPLADKATELLTAEELGKVAGWMRRNGHWDNGDDVVTREEQRWLATLERAALLRADTPWRTVLDLAGQSVTEADVRHAYQRKAMQAHPDRGGTDVQMQRLNRAREQALAEVAAARAA
jgi:hypothetical protein